ncbi:hypothetical protein PVAND_010864 [Polypedilum vanderplanki]|uniref:Uncharacterized protein n=1 Tax=Polypedilum vanderplanki TaxID=319348 RepID=A0A9J6CI61_POLVA|nr:hypothetical protein PVAND_010864 [Polypedilum vanderplanki]
MERVKPSAHEIYGVLEEKKKLLEIRNQVDVVLDKIKNVLNNLAVENYQLTQTELGEELNDKDEEKHKIPAVNFKKEEVMPSNTIEESVINQQLLDIDVKPCFDMMEIDSDEELDQL